MLFTISIEGGRTVDELVAYVQEETTEGAMLDQFAFANSQHALDTDIVVDGIISNERAYGIFVQSGNIRLNECFMMYSAANRNRFFQWLADTIKPLSVGTFW